MLPESLAISMPQPGDQRIFHPTGPSRRLLTLGRCCPAWPETHASVRGASVRESVFLSADDLRCTAGPSQLLHKVNGGLPLGCSRASEACSKPLLVDWAARPPDLILQGRIEVHERPRSPRAVLSQHIWMCMQGLQHPPERTASLSHSTVEQPRRRFRRCCGHKLGCGSGVALHCCSARWLTNWELQRPLGPAKSTSAEQKLRGIDIQVCPRSLVDCEITGI